MAAVFDRATLSTFQRLISDQGGLALTEFAIVTPVLMIMVASGLELGNFMLVKRRVGDVAVQVADNASRLGLESILASKQVREVDINDVFTGARLQGDKINLMDNGRIILSSLETNATGGQWIHWQRCFGKLAHASSYGKEGDGSTGSSLSGMGPAGSQITAAPGSAVMFVEVAYQYKPLVSFTPFNFGTITEVASYTIRDNRDLTQIYNPAPAATASTCT